MFKVYIFHFVLDIFAYYINFSVVFQTGKEGINYAGTCSDNLDNNCNGLTDDEDDACDAEVSLSVTNGNNLCNYQTQSFTINLRNRENVGIWEVSVTDRIYDSNNNLEYTGNAHCENVIANGICSNSYNVNLDTGSYYHNVAATYGNNEQITKNNYNAFAVLSNDNIACCADEGEVPTGGRICCDGRATEGANGACGCPSGFTFSTDLGKCIPGGEICWSSDANERNDIGKCLAQELTITFLLNNLFVNNQYNSNILDCFSPRPNQENPTQTCCPYITYDNKNYGEYQNIEVY